MANLNKETLRAACQDNPGQSMMICTDDVLALLDEISLMRSQYQEWRESHHANYCFVADQRDDLLAEVEILKARLKACHPFRPAQEIKP